MRINPASVARASSRHPWRTIGLWAVVLGAGIALSTALLGRALTTEFNFTNRPESVRARSLIEERLTGREPVTEIYIVRSERYTVEDPAFEAFVRRLQRDLAALGPGVVRSVVSPFDTGLPTQVSPDGREVLVTAVLAGDLDRASRHVEELEAVRDRADADPAFETYAFGAPTVTEDFKRVSEEDLRKGEGIGIGVALIVLVAVFGAVVAGVIPIVLGVFAIAVALGLLALVGLLFDLSFFVTNMVSMMGLAVGIDYSLFILSRYREERARGWAKLEAIARAGSTANRAVFFSGTVVVLALLGMLIVPSTVFRSLAAGA
ncbi:MAG TPA: MMPL family transporter, partial [Actinomycetota bacterium]|nr:MMPL family transporter [Actinomycetota bacterium]